MRGVIRSLLLTAALLPSLALAQTPLPNPIVLPPNTIVGRGNLGSSGYPYAMSFQEFVNTLGTLGLATAQGAASGDLSGSYPAPTVAKINGVAPPNSGLWKGNGAGGAVAAVAGTDYAAPPALSSILKGNGAGGFASAVAGTDYAPPTTGTSLLKGNGAGGFSNGAACADLSNAAASCSTDATNASNISTGTLGSARLPAPFTSATRQGSTSAFVTYNGAAPTSGHVATYDASGNIQDGGNPAGSGTVTQVVCGTGLSGGTITSSGTCAVSLSALTNSLASNVALNNTSTYFDGPSVAQGTTGTWLATGTVTLTDTVGGASAAMLCKLWDGTTVIASSTVNIPSANFNSTMSLSGYLASPAGNIRISCKDTLTSGFILYSGTALGKDSTISVIRIN